jgi:hypothetical protein
VITNPRRVTVASSPTEALRIIAALLALPGLRVLPIPARAVAGWIELLRRHPVTGGEVFDLQIVATMQANGVQRIYTFNTDDFTVFPELAAVTPSGQPRKGQETATIYLWRTGAQDGCTQCLKAISKPLPCRNPDEEHPGMAFR